MKSPFFVLASFGSHNQKIYIFASSQPNHANHLLSGLYNLLKYNFYSLRSPPGDPRVAHCSHFSVRILPPDFVFFSPLTGISARGPQGRSDTALRLVSYFCPHMQLGFPPSSLFRKGSPRTNCLLCAPPSLIQRQISTHPVAAISPIPL
jgi:hypothetical protein